MRNPRHPSTGGGAPVLVLFGPTASGKTALAEALFAGQAPLCRAEIVSADSMQVYRGMDIGTAKPDAALRQKLHHHLVDIRSPGDQFNAGDFVRLADKACAEIAGLGALPVLLGGTGFYLKNFIYGLPAAPPSDPALRKKLKTELAEKGNEALRERLAALDPVSAARIHPNDTYRLLRAREVGAASGSPLSSFAQGETKRPLYHFLITGLQLPRGELYRRIDERCADMFRRGLPDEVEALFHAGYTPDDPGLRAIGYREFFVADEESPPHYDEKAAQSGGTGRARWRLSRDTQGTEALVARNSRRYAKRQETFFASIHGVHWIPAAVSPGDAARTLDLLSSLIHTEFNAND